MVFFICDMLWLFFYTKINHCWTTFETLAEIEREKERGRLRERERERERERKRQTAKNDNSALEIVKTVLNWYFPYLLTKRSSLQCTFRILQR